MAAPPIVMRVNPWPNGARSTAYASTRLLQEWVELRYSGLPVFPDLRLGPTSKSLAGVQVSPQYESMLRVANWYADAVIVAPTELLVVEAKVDPDPGAVGQVLFYRTLLYSTPALAAYTTMPVMPVVLFGEDDSGVTPFARGLGCRVEIYTPPWIAQYLETRQFRNRSTPVPGTTA